VDELLKEIGDSSDGSSIDKLLALEKQTRNAADLSSTSRILVKIIETLKDKGDWEGVNLQLTALSKKHGQLREATRRMVDRAMEWLGELDNNKDNNQEKRLKLIETLRDVTEGKIYLEVPRARVTRLLSSIKESSGDVTTASDLLQELQVETFASMERREKLEFILEQMRLLRVKENWDMLAIVSKKVNTKWLDDKDNEDLKFKFYNLMIQYCLQTNKYLEVSKHYRSLYLSPSVTPPRTSTAVPVASASSESKDSKKQKESESKPAESSDVKMDEESTPSQPTKDWRPLLRNIIFFTILSPYDNEQSDILHRILKDEDERLTQLPDCLNLAKCFTTPELTRWPRIESLYGPGLRETRVFGSNGVGGVEGDIEQTLDAGQGEKRFSDLHKRVVEHNIRIISKYYKRITLSRLSQLLDLSEKETEESLCKMVVGKNVNAKIDRPSGIVDFEEKNKGTYKVLNEWSRDVGKLMALVEATSHLIGKEHAIAQAAKQRAAAIKA